MKEEKKLLWWREIEVTLSKSKSCHHLLIHNSQWLQPTSTSLQEKLGCRTEIWTSLIVLQGDQGFYNEFNNLDTEKTSLNIGKSQKFCWLSEFYSSGDGYSLWNVFTLWVNILLAMCSCWILKINETIKLWCQEHPLIRL